MDTTAAVLNPPPGDFGVRSTRYVRPPAASRLDSSINRPLCEPTRYNSSDISQSELQVANSRIIAMDAVTMMVIMMMLTMI